MDDRAIRIDLCLVVEGPIVFEHATGPGPRHLVCGNCGNSSYWLLCAGQETAWATCTCGVRARHPDITPALITELAGTPEAIWSSMEDAEEGFISGHM